MELQKKLKEAQRLGILIKFFDYENLLDGFLGSFIEGGMEIMRKEYDSKVSKASERLKQDIENIKPKADPGILGAVLDESFNEKVSQFVEIAKQVFENSTQNNKTYFGSSIDFLYHCIHNAGFAIPQNPYHSVAGFLNYGNSSNGQLGDIAVFKDWVGIVIETNENETKILQQESQNMSIFSIAYNTPIDELICFRSLV